MCEYKLEIEARNMTRTAKAFEAVQAAKIQCLPIKRLLNDLPILFNLKGCMQTYI